MKTIYIFHPYTDKNKKNIIKNIKNVKQYAIHLYKQGNIQLFTHGIFGIQNETKKMRKKILDFCCKLIVNCDEVHILLNKNNTISVGMKQEREYAKQNDIKIQYIKKIKNNYSQVNLC